MLRSLNRLLARHRWSGRRICRRSIDSRLWGRRLVVATRNGCLKGHLQMVSCRLNDREATGHPRRRVRSSLLFDRHV